MSDDDVGAESAEDEELRDAATKEEAQEGGSPIEKETAEAALRGEEFKPWDEYHEAFGDPAPIRQIMDEGLPTQLVNDSLADAHAPPYTEETYVCMADTREFVLRKIWGEIVARWAPDKVTRQPDGTWTARWCDAREFAGGESPPANEEWVPVEPVRAECKHYLRQLIPPPAGSTGLKYGLMHRLCALRRTITGAFMSLTDEAMRACSMRDPFDQESHRLLDEMDAIKARMGRERVMLPIFNLQDAIRGSIFDPNSKGDA